MLLLVNPLLSVVENTFIAGKAKLEKLFSKSFMKFGLFFAPSNTSQSQVVIFAIVGSTCSFETFCC